MRKFMGSQHDGTCSLWQATRDTVASKAAATVRKLRQTVGNGDAGSIPAESIISAVQQAILTLLAFAPILLLCLFGGNQ